MKRNKWATMMTSLMLLSSVAMGCTSNEGSQPSPTPNGQEPAKKAVNGKFEPPVTITTARVVGSDYVFINGETIQDNVHNKWAKEKLGIEIKDLWDTPDNAAYHTKIRLSLTTQNQLPDLFIVQDPNLIADLMQSGKVMDIQQAFDKYASERMKKLYSDNKSALNQVKANGKLLGLPIFSGGDGTNPVMWIRQDWLDQLNLKAPTTIEEFEKVMDAFTNQDPDGNGKKDTFGFSFAAKNGFSNWMSDASFVFGAYSGKFLPMSGDRPHWQKASDGTLKYGSIQPGIKDALGKMRDWYGKGYLDPELAALDEIKATESFIQGKSGIIAAPFWANGWPLGDVTKNNPNALVRAYPLPVGPDGKTARYNGLINEGKVMMFNKDFKHMDAFFLYMDKIYDSPFSTGDFKDGFFEGYDYAMVNGEPVYDPKKFPKPLEKAATSGKYNLFWNTPAIPFQGSKDWDYIYQGNKPETAGQKAITVADKEQIRAGALNYQLKNSNAPTEFIGSPTETQRSKGENLKTMELETFAKIIYGKEPLDKFDSFVADWKSKGGDQIEKEVNDWYKSVNQ
ncbi:extracellular solute-binding protein [Paenibacillus sedimenti]|uniref:Extracellular solute-binding protein n=1 Tax=Paenibacillus sedimenti TaxID=2770274 RepID=A0A926QM92_9BACL|nr:extracellular solute-binding protein [Paenibacillus sedimenti]MBD0384430.1 extracellular solute-binding protein [Paenibacillus sedimenti]